MLPGTPDNPSKDQQLARMALMFLNRCSMQPHEINQFVLVNQWLEGIVNQPIDPPKSLADAPAKG